MSDPTLGPGVPDQTQAQAEPRTPGTVALSADDFKSLEERILRAVDMVKRERQARVDAEERAAVAESQLKNEAPHIEQMEKELRVMRAERDHVRQRVERLLAQLDALEL
jgi:hypothetical protein